MKRWIHHGAAGVLLGVTLLASPVNADIPWRSLREGSHAEVELERKGGRWVANEIDLRTSGAPNDVEITAPVESVTPTEIRVLDVSLSLTDATRWRRESGEAVAAGSINAGDWVEVDGRLTDGRWVARRVKLLTEPSRRPELEGRVLDARPGSRELIIGEVSFAVGSKTKVRGSSIDVPRAIDDDDARPEFLTAWNGDLLLGGSATGDWEPERNFDLNDSRPDELSRSSWSMEVVADLTASPTLEFFTKLGVSGTEVLLDDEGDERDDQRFRLPQAFALWRPHRDIAVQIGRQDFDEPREWLYDENLDAVRIHAQRGRYRAELSVSQRWNVDGLRLRDWTNWIGLLRRELRRGWHGELFFVHRRHPDGQDPLWLGARTRGRITSAVRHWLDLAALSGNFDGSSRIAWGVDAGLRVRIERRYRTSVSFGYAAGSGGNDESGTFRQTGLHDNNDKFSGVSSLRYYGELLDPELSNLSIVTLAAGLRPTRATSIDVVWHRYDQRRLHNRLTDTNLDRRPTGRHGRLGTEWDVVVAFEEISQFDVEYVFARFSPGAAFDSAARPATLHKLSFRYGF